MHFGELREQRLDEIEVSHRYAATRDDDVAVGDAVDEERSQGGCIVRTTPRPDDIRAGFSESRDQAEAVGIADLARTWCLRGLNQLVSGRQDAHPGTARHRYWIDSQTGQEAHLGGAEEAAALQHVGPFCQ